MCMNYIILINLLLLLPSLLAGEAFHFAADGDESSWYLEIKDTKYEFYETGIRGVISRSRGTVSISGDTWRFTMTDYEDQLLSINEECYVERTVEETTYLIPISRLDDFMSIVDIRDSFARSLSSRWYIRKTPNAPAFLCELDQMKFVADNSTGDFGSGNGYRDYMSAVRQAKKKLLGIRFTHGNEYSILISKVIDENGNEVYKLSDPIEGIGCDVGPAVMALLQRNQGDIVGMSHLHSKEHHLSATDFMMALYYNISISAVANGAGELYVVPSDLDATKRMDYAKAWKEAYAADQRGIKYRYEGRFCDRPDDGSSTYVPDNSFTDIY